MSLSYLCSTFFALVFIQAIPCYFLQVNLKWIVLQIQPFQFGQFVKTDGEKNQLVSKEIEMLKTL